MRDSKSEESKLENSLASGRFVDLESGDLNWVIQLQIESKSERSHDPVKDLSSKQLVTIEAVNCFK